MFFLKIPVVCAPSWYEENVNVVLSTCLGGSVFFYLFFVRNCVSPLNGEWIKYVSASSDCSLIGYLCLDAIPHIRHVIRLVTTAECLTSKSDFYAYNLKLCAHALKGNKSQHKTFSNFKNHIVSFYTILSW